MEYKEFKSKMEVLIRFYREQSEMGKTIEKAFSCHSYVVVEFGQELANAYQNMLEKAVGDNSDWISYWLWECDMGKKPQGWSKKGEQAMRPMKTLKNLWDAIQIDNKEA